MSKWWSWKWAFVGACGWILFFYASIEPYRSEESGRVIESSVAWPTFVYGGLIVLTLSGIVGAMLAAAFGKGYSGISGEDAPTRRAAVSALAWIMVGIAGVLLVVALGMDTSVPTDSGDRVYNLGLLASQRNLRVFGGLLALVGVLVLLRVSGTTPDGRNRGQTRQCPYCAETIKRAATICRFCQRNLSEPIDTAPPAREIEG